MDNTLMEALLNEDESSSLDFKRDQYPFIGTSEEQKSEVIKDILAFANAWRRTDAYILIGVEEVKGGRSVVCGVESHLDDSDLQQLVNSKINRPIQFSYQAYPYEGKQVGVIRIPVQTRPFSLKRSFGKLKENAVYCRQGSSTAVALPDEIARMGAASVPTAEVPTLDLQFANAESGLPAGTILHLDSLVLRLPEQSQIPDARPKSSGLYNLEVLISNDDYYREFAKYLFIHRLVKPVKFVLRNTGSTLLINACLQLLILNEEGLQVCTEDDLPDIPYYDSLPIQLGNSLLLAHTRNTVSIHLANNQYEILVECGSIQPKAISKTERFYIGTEIPRTIQCKGVVFADNLPDPVRVPLAIEISPIEKPMDVQQLLQAIKGFEQEQRKKYERT